MTRFAVLLGGDVTPTDRLRKQVAGSRVIADKLFPYVKRLVQQVKARK